MKTPVPDYLQHVLHSCQANDAGALADYIPELAQANPNYLALALATIDGNLYTVGDCEVEFTIQSMSKPFAYALALQQLGLDRVAQKVGVEPSGEAFNQISLDPDAHHPKNPMINSGAMTVHALLGEGGAEQIRALLSELAERELVFDEKVYQSERQTAFRNLSIAYMLRTFGVIEQDPQQVVEGYIRQCAILVTVQDLAKMASVLANGGVQASSGKRIFSAAVVRQVLSVMLSCGMYDAAGDWLSHVGIPAKSGVAGGVLGALPGQVGLAAFSPKLDEHGNSVRAMAMFERLSQDMGLHVMQGTPSAQTILQSRQVLEEHNTVVYELRGVLQFTESEMLLRHMQQEPPEQHCILLDLTPLSAVHDVGARMLIEGVSRLMQDGHQVWILDSENILANSSVADHQAILNVSLEHYLQSST